VYPDPLSAQAQARFSGQGQQGQGSPGGGGGGAYLDSAPRDPETGPPCVAVCCVRVSRACDSSAVCRVCHSSPPSLRHQGCGYLRLHCAFLYPMCLHVVAHAIRKASLVCVVAQQLGVCGGA
jgi:hypothetical protein